MHIQIAIATIVAVLASSCAYNPQTINGGGGGGGSRTIRHDSPKVTSASKVFSNQPMNPTADAVPSTWGATMGSEYWWNDARKGDRALLQRTSPDEPVLVSRSTGHVWRKGCFNRVAPAEPFTEGVVQEQVASGGSNYSNTDYKFSFFENFKVEIYNSGQEGYRQGCPPPRRMTRAPSGYCPPRPMMRPPPRPYCPPRPVYRPRPPRPCPPGMYRRC
jgi:hypothetical protein